MDDAAGPSDRDPGDGNDGGGRDHDPAADPDAGDAEYGAADAGVGPAAAAGTVNDGDDGDLAALRREVEEKHDFFRDITHPV